MPPSSLILDRPVVSMTAEREQQIAKLTRAMYPVDRQEKFLELQAEVETLFCQLQSLQQVRK
jgi:hypothetical protein